MRNKRYDFIHLPEEFHCRHQLCENFLYQLEDFLLKEPYNKLKTETVQFTEEPSFNDGEHFLDYLKRIGLTDKHDRIITSFTLNAVIADTCSFLQIALFASLQKRLTVTFSLIRKPFVYNLVVILRLYFNIDFLHRFNYEDEFDTANASTEEIMALLEISTQVARSTPITAQDLYSIIFDKNDMGSIINISNRALHPSTTRKNNKTGKQGLNFVYSNDDQINSQWDYLYSMLPALLHYLIDVLDFIVHDHLDISEEIRIERLKERLFFMKASIEK